MVTWGPVGMRELPHDWESVEGPMYETALDQTRRAFGVEGTDRALDHLAEYFDPHGRYAGNTFLAVGPNEPFAVTASDLWAVTTLSMKVPPAAGRALLDPGPLRDAVERGLRLLPESLPLARATPEVLQVLETTYSAVRSQLPSPRAGAKTTNQWVLASKLMARKRPLLFPVRDSLVCKYLAGGAGLGGNAGQLGWFRRDIQVFAYLMAHEEVVACLEAVRNAMADAYPAWSLGPSDLRLLDAVLWMAALRDKTSS